MDYIGELLTRSLDGAGRVATGITVTLGVVAGLSLAGVVRLTDADWSNVTVWALIGGAIAFALFLLIVAPYLMWRDARQAAAPGSATSERERRLLSVIEHARALRVRLTDADDPMYPVAEPAFRCWQAQIEGFDKRAEETLNKVAKERLGGYALPVQLAQAGGRYAGLPESVKNLAIELDERIERLEVIRAAPR